VWRWGGRRGVAIPPQNGIKIQDSRFNVFGIRIDQKDDAFLRIGFRVGLGLGLGLGMRWDTAPDALLFWEAGLDKCGNLDPWFGIWFWSRFKSVLLFVED